MPGAASRLSSKSTLDKRGNEITTPVMRRRHRKAATAGWPSPLFILRSGGELELMIDACLRCDHVVGRAHPEPLHLHGQRALDLLEIAALVGHGKGARNAAL